jgi:hypothetical protein
MTAAPCKHQYAVVRHFNVSSLNFVPLRDEKMREHLLFLASGQDIDQIGPGWFTSLHGDGHSNTNFREHGESDNDHEDAVDDSTDPSDTKMLLMTPQIHLI